MHRSGRIKYSALDLVDLYRLDLPKDGICVSVWTDVPAVLHINALRDSPRVWMGARRQCATVRPSSRHGRGVTEAAGKGTRAWTSR